MVPHCKPSKYFTDSNRKEREREIIADNPKKMDIILATMNVALVHIGASLRATKIITEGKNPYGPSVAFGPESYLIHYI